MRMWRGLLIGAICVWAGGAWSLARGAELPRRETGDGAVEAEAFDLNSELGPRVLFEKESLYHYIVVEEDAGVRRMRFRRAGEHFEESVISVKEPLNLHFGYYEQMFAGFAFVPAPKDVLLVGLGGGTLAIVMHHYFPEVNIDNVELDPDVVHAAKAYFGFKENKRVKVYVRDGRVQTRVLGRGGKRYDMILLDAFRGGYIPYHLTTREYMEQVKSLLRPGGVVVSNLRSGFASYHYQRRTMAKVFPYQWESDGGGNVIVVTSAARQPLKRETLMKNARRLQKSKEFTFDLPSIIERGESPGDYETSGRILTDDFAPTDVLRGIPAE